MASVSWVCRLRSSSKTLYTRLLTPRLHPKNPPSELHRTPVSRSPFPWWVPALLAASITPFAVQFDSSPPALCDAPATDDLNLRGASIGGKGSTEFIVKGAHRSVPNELIDELKAICGENMTTDYDERLYHGKPQNSFHRAVNVPDVVVFPK